jgi:hypothetical protein
MRVVGRLRATQIPGDVSYLGGERSPAGLLLADQLVAAESHEMEISADRLVRWFFRGDAGKVPAISDWLSSLGLGYNPLSNRNFQCAELAAPCP